MVPRLALTGLVLVFVATACGGKKADCDAAAKNAVALIRAELENEGAEADRQRKESMLPALKEELVRQCKAEKWDVAVRTCVAEAKRTGELDKCDPDGKRGEPDEEPDDKPATDKPATDKPATGAGDKPATGAGDKPSADKPAMGAGDKPAGATGAPAPAE